MELQIQISNTLSKYNTYSGCKSLYNFVMIVKQKPDCKNAVGFFCLVRLRILEPAKDKCVHQFIFLILLIALSDKAVIVREGFTPGLALIIEPSQMSMFS